MLGRAKSEYLSREPFLTRLLNISNAAMFRLPWATTESQFRAGKAQANVRGFTMRSRAPLEVSSHREKAS